MVADGPFEGNAFDDVGVKRPLGQVFDPAQLLGFGGEDADEFVADAAPLLLRVDDPFQLAQEVHGGVDVNQVEVVMLPEEVEHFLRLPFAQQAVVDEDAGQAVADGPVDQHRGDRGVHPAGQGADDLAVAHLLPDVLGGGLDEGGHGPQRIELADAEQEVAEDLLAPGRVMHFGMELHPVQPPGEVRMAPVGQLSLWPITSNPGARRSTRSPWLIQTCSSGVQAVKTHLSKLLMKKVL